MSTPADSTTNSVSLLLPIYFDVSGVNVELFGQLVELSGVILPIVQTIPAASFYIDTSNSYIAYRQDISENIFSVDISRAYALQIAQDISASLYIQEGQTYDVTKRGVEHVDASAAFVNVGNPFRYYNSLQDFIVSYFANKILGHPGALAAISNDSSIRAATTTVFSDAEISFKLSSASREEGSLTDDDAKAIVQQVINQDLARFNQIDKRDDGFTSLPLLAGDKIYLQIRLYGNSYSLKTPAGNPSQISTGIVLPANQNAGTTPTPINPGSYDYYLLEFTLA
jgi:hypothetical protein